MSIKNFFNLFFIILLVNTPAWICASTGNWKHILLYLPMIVLLQVVTLIYQNENTDNG